MSHDQRPARVKVVSVKDAAGGPGDSAPGNAGGAGGANANSGGAAHGASASASPAAKTGASTMLLSFLFIVASVIGGIGIAIAPLLSGR